MKLSQTFGHKVRVTFKDGDVMVGKVNCYISALDNEPDPESIMIDEFELYEPEIEKVEILD